MNKINWILLIVLLIQIVLILALDNPWSSGSIVQAGQSIVRAETVRAETVRAETVRAETVRRETIRRGGWCPGRW